MAMTLGNAAIWIDGKMAFDGATITAPTFDLSEIIQEVALLASAGPQSPLGDFSQIVASCTAFTYQDDDAHDGCSLTACLNPLHPGPCKGWKGNLFKVAPNAFHALEAARVEKANTARLKKIQALKDAGKPIPKKLLTPIVAKPHPHAGKTANAATGEAHAAGQAISHANGIHSNEPGKVTLGQAVKEIKATDATNEKGKLGKKPTVASKGIAHVIAQEKVTPQYKLDKADKITPEQWNALSHDEKAIIRGELKKIQKDGFGPQQKKATELLGKLPAEGTVVAPEPKLGELTPGAPNTITTPSGKTYQKINLKGETAPKPAEKTPEAPASPGNAPTLKEQGLASIHDVKVGHTFTGDDGGQYKVTETPAQGKIKGFRFTSSKHGGSEVLASKLQFAKLTGLSVEPATPKQEPKLGDLTPGMPGTITAPSGKVYQKVDLKPSAETGAPSSKQAEAMLAIGNAINPQKGTAESLTKGIDLMKGQAAAKGMPVEEHHAFKAVVTKLANSLQKQAYEDKMPNPEGIDVYHKQIAEHIKEGKSGLPPVVQATVNHHNKVKASDAEAQAKIDAMIKAHEAAPPAVHTPGQAKLSDVTTSLPKNSELHATVPEAKVSKPLPEHVQHAIAMAKGQAPGASWSKNHLAAYLPLKAEEFHALDPEVQAKIKLELNKALDKLLDPKKKAAVAELLDRFKGKPDKIENVDFKTHLNDHSVTEAQAKQAVTETPVAQLAALAQKLAGTTPAEDPDSLTHKYAAQESAVHLLGQSISSYGKDVLNDSNVKQAMANFKTAHENVTYAQAVAKAKQTSYNKVTKRLLQTTGEKLSPVELASLRQYRQHLLNHPVNTDFTEIDKLNAEASQATKQLLDALQKAHKPSNPETLTPAMFGDQAAKLLGPEAGHPKVNLSLAEAKAATQEGMKVAAKESLPYPSSIFDSPEATAKYNDLANRAGDLADTEKSQAKLAEHIKSLHMNALTTGKDVHGNQLSAYDKAVIATHADMLKTAHAYLDTAHADQLQKVAKAKAAFHEAAKESQAPGGPKKALASLTDGDKTNIQEAYQKAWNEAASKAVLYGVKGWTQKQQMKDHPEYAPLTQDLGELRALAGKLALAHAEVHTADLNVPTDPASGAKLDGPEKQAWIQAVININTLETQALARHKTAQMRLDKIREDVGLKKRALPKLDNAAVKAKAAESGYYKTAGYGGINYGKTAKAKNYMLAKVGPKHAVAHVTAAEKKAEKNAAEQEKIKLAAEAAKATAAMVKGTASPAAAKLKADMPSAADAGEKPNAVAAAKYGFKFEANAHLDLDGWPGSGSVYYANDDHWEEAAKHLESPDTKYGQEAQKEFKWSIDNMVGKGASVAQRNALYGYTGTGYSIVNDKLNSLPPGMPKTGSGTITSIDNAMAASPAMAGDVVLYRGFKSPHTVFGASGKWNDVNVAGMEWSQRSYSSTSGTLSTAEGFAGYSGAVMRIIIPKEMQVHGINAKGGQHGGENEIILQRGLRYRVVADYGKKNGMRYIDVMVVPNPYDKAK